MEIMKLIPTGKDYLWGGTRLREEYGKKIVEKTKEYPWDEYDSGDILIKKKMDYLWKR